MIEVLPIGAVVNVSLSAREPVEAIVVAIQVRGLKQMTVRYQVEWWDGRQNRNEWFDDWQVLPIAGGHDRRLSIGFAGHEK